jgi:aryl-alcohol dehydrogenase-like predicted oxidoreductase
MTLRDRRNGLVVLAYGALCRGLLTGKITAKTEFKGDDLRKVDPNSSNRGSDTILRRSPASMPSHASKSGFFLR